MWVGGFGLGAIAALASQNTGTQAMGFEFAAMWLLISPVLWVTCAPLKRVKFDGATLWISNYRTEISVSVDAVAAVTQNKLFNLRPVFLTFKRETSFGRGIVFMPWASFRLFSDDAIVVELRRAARLEVGS